MKINVLDKGFVRLVDHMGDDSSIVQMARVSYGEGTKKVSEDKGLIRYLLRNRHTSPFEGVTFKFHVRAPIFVIRQWHRHRTWAYNEMSGRYSVMPEDCYVPKEEHVTTQDPNNKQGGTSTAIPWIADQSPYLSWHDAIEAQQDYIKECYDEMLDTGMRRELARINLPLSQYTEMYAVVNLHNLLHFLRLRLDSHAQYEIRVFAEALYECVKSVCPITAEAFEDYQLNGTYLTGLDIEVLQKYLENYTSISLEDVSNNIIKNKRERNECMQKLKKILDL